MWDRRGARGGGCVFCFVFNSFTHTIHFFPQPTLSELRTKDLERIGNVVADLRAKEKRPGFGKEQKEELAIAFKIEEWLNEGKDVRFGEWSAREVEFLNTNPMITSKPVS